ncbi:MAG: hypothetical protein EXS00_02500 [Phycisphaerales bacterium]|nr:hypothetical protein [Phycisphaerales bacterium]
MRVAPHQFREATAATRAIWDLADAPVIAWGHQPVVWHPGILAKGLACEKLARELHGSVLHLIADHDAIDCGACDFPDLIDGAWHRRTWQALSADFLTGGPRVACAQPASTPRTPPSVTAALPCVAAGMHNIFAALTASEESTAAAQVYRANCALAQRWLSPARAIYGSDLLTSPLGAHLLQLMISGPNDCARAFNDAVAQSDSQIAKPLEINEDPQRTELPLWKLHRSGARSRATAADAAAATQSAFGGKLLPTAVIATGIVRLVADRFVHGTGGAHYDARGDEFWRRWLGVAPVSFDVATADLRLPLEPTLATTSAAEPPDSRPFRFDPWRELPNLPSARLTQLLAAVSNAAPGSAERRAAYRTMKQTVEAARLAISDRLEQMDAQRAQWFKHSLSVEVMQARDWPFPLYPSEMIDQLAARWRAG